MTENNSYGVFLQEKKERPRLSILDNYKQIMRIMTTSYIKSQDEEKKFRDRKVLEKPVHGQEAANFEEDDPEYASYKEEKNNTQKMSVILKSV